MRLRSAALFFTIGVVLVGPAVGLANPPATDPTTPLTEIRDRIEMLSKDKDLKGLERLGEQLEDQWARGGRDRYGYEMRTLVGVLGSDQLGEDRQFKVERRFTLLALAKGDEIGLADEVELVQRLQSDPKYTPAILTEPWPTERSREMKFWFHAVNRLAEAIDRKWVNKPPRAQAALPPGVPGASGMSPDAIQDPKLRAEYIVAVQKLHAEQERYNQQFEARELEHEFLGKAKRYIISSFSKPPLADAELKAYLDASRFEEPSKAEILAKVAKEIAQVPKTAAQKAP